MLIRNFVFLLLLAVLTGCAIYAAMIAWLFAGWFIDDSVAATLSRWGWLRIALLRVLGALAIGTLVALASWFVLRLGRAVLRLDASTRDPYNAAILGALPAAAGIVGAVQFALERPYL